jgi:hypothetical protein
VRAIQPTDHVSLVIAATPTSLRFLVSVCALVGALLLVAIAPSGAHAANVVGPTGQISACYAKKGKSQGALRVVRPGKRCRKGEAPVSLSARGQQGTSGAQGGSGQVDSSVTSQITELQSRVTELEGVLSGLTNTDLLNAVGAVATVDALCTTMSTAVGQLNSIRTVLSGLTLGGVIPLGLVLSVPSLPSALSPFSCS